MVYVTPSGERLDQDRRKSRRWPAHASCSIRGRNGELGSVTVWNISEGGFGAECEPGYQDGDELTLRLGRMGHAPARVVWRIGSVIGCAFLRPVTPAEVALTIATAIQVPPRIDDDGTAA